tara:strand:+ start:1250 stop:1858 length:609 start_codon:yes stop_codon:yes gene_type:complete
LVGDFLNRAKLIVLKAIKHSESDLLVQTLSATGDRLHFLAKGALKSKKRFGGGVLEPTHYLDVLYKEGKSSSDSEPLHILLEARVIRDFSGLREDYDRLNMALSFLSLVSRLTRSGSVGAKEIFDLLGHGLSACEGDCNPETLSIQFRAKLLFSQGVLEPSSDMAVLIRTSLKSSSDIQLSKAQRKTLDHHLHLATEEMLHL